LIKDLFKDRTVIFATHDKSLIERYPARVIELNNGKIISDSANNEKVNISNI
jgi:ABC-type ATPase involved in cell division